MKGRRLFLAVSVILFLFGGILGIFYSSNKLLASSPQDKTSGGKPASVFYDEHWQAIGAYVATKRGYAFLNPSTGHSSPVAGKIEYTPVATPSGVVNVPRATLEPDMVITKWKVHGHVHFE